MKKEDIIELVKKAKEEIASKYKAEVKGIFGSFVRDEAGPQSDLDVLVEFKEGANLLHLSGLSLFLEEKIHVPVDIVPIDTIKKDIKEDILRGAIYI